ncbi:succinylglutamate desuccinylase/aspartoacylase family protein [Rhodoligotrophos defluvii]|uniref:succinylglutamate desuccinylase/aspartoacylase family protein n=1 Tax=Rhodoligotrophos defluvii TaxID=2561934 RepID=UPI00148533B9|nr:succinylglutamate desuccinylase/aspartoacylase family protein [Rhodoligotrophos defluvii]
MQRSEISFPYPALAGWRWPAVVFTGRRPGPKLAVIAGIHVNETSSIEAVIRLQRLIRPEDLSGEIRIIPVVNLPAVPHRSQYICPIDGKNINFSFPGRPDGTFSEQLAWALLDDWARDADCFIDLHGGDLCENVAHFTVAQQIGDEAFDRRNVEIAACFDAELIVRLAPSHLEKPGRSCTGRATRRQHAAFAEAGRIGIIEERNVEFHLNGVLRVAQLLGMITSAPPKSRAPVFVDEYLWIPAPHDGFYRYHVNPGQKVEQGQVLAVAENTYGDRLGDVRAPVSGYILWSLTHAFVMKDSFVMGLGKPAA